MASIAVVKKSQNVHIELNETVMLLLDNEQQAELLEEIAVRAQQQADDVRRGPDLAAPARTIEQEE